MASLIERRKMMMSLKEWLNSFAKTEIISVFGLTDGREVIRATNAYLDNMALSEHLRATNMASFINEDPMIVCSLPLSTSITMPRRYIELDGNCWFDTYYAYSSMSQIMINAELKVAEMAVVGNESGGYPGLQLWTDRVLYVNNLGAGSYSAEWAEIIFTPTWLTYNGSARRTYNATFNNLNLLIGKMSGLQNSTLKYQNIGFYSGGVEHFIIPYIHKEGNLEIPELLDITTFAALSKLGTGTPSIPSIIYNP